MTDDVGVGSGCSRRTCLNSNFPLSGTSTLIPVEGDGGSGVGCAVDVVRTSTGGSYL